MEDGLKELENEIYSYVKNVMEKIFKLEKK